jgi:hypothetical protein
MCSDVVLIHPARLSRVGLIDGAPELRNPGQSGLHGIGNNVSKRSVMLYGIIRRVVCGISSTIHFGTSTVTVVVRLDPGTGSNM